MKTLRIVLVGLVALAAGVVASAGAQTLLLTLDTPNPQANAEFGHSLAVGDVNGDGKADIAVGTPWEDVGGNAEQGRAYVFSGADGSLLFTLDSPNPDGGGDFAHSVAVGDVNGDGKADVAVGARKETVSGNHGQGRAYVFSGADGSLLFTLDTPNPQAWADFGESVAVGDVNADGKADVAIGTPQETVSGNHAQGRAYVFSGFDGSLLFTLDTPNPQVVSLFGWSVAMGDVNADGKGDIAAGALWEERAYVFSGADGSLLFTLHTPNPQAWGFFGWSVAMGDINADGNLDIAVGESGEGTGKQQRAYVFSGADGSLLFTLDAPNPEGGGHFADSLAVGDVNGDGEADIAVGAWGEDVAGNYDQGRAYVFSGADGSLLFTLDTPNPQVVALFGRSVAVGDVTGKGRVEIAVGAGGEDVSGNENQGRAYVFSLALAISVEVDIKPGSDPNSINLSCHGVIPVAILTTEDFDATTVDPEMVLFEGAAAKHWAPEDVDEDGDIDLILHFKCREVSIEPDADEACLEGQTYDGQEIEGCDSVRLVPPDSPADSDGDGFTDAIEVCMGTDPSDDCPDDRADDAWPPDIDNDTDADIVDVLKFRPVIMSKLGDVNYDKRFDFNADGNINIIDVLNYTPVIMTSCTP